MLVFEPQIPMGLWWAIAVLALLAWVWYALARDSGLGLVRRGLVLGLMAIVLIAPLILLLNPTWIEPIVPPAGKPLITVLVDATQSMQVDDVDNDSRWKAAVQMANEIKTSASQEFDVNIIRFGKIMQPVDSESSSLPPDGSNTNLSGVLRQTLAVNRPQGHAICLLSDGAHNVGSTLGVTAAADNARALDVPIYTTPFGGSVGASNVAIAVRNPQLMTFPDRPVNVRVQLSQRSFGGRAVTVGLLESGEQIAAKRVRLSPDGPSETEFTIRPTDAGMYRYVVAVTPIDGEATTADNQASLQVQVIDEPIRVLLLEGKPYWDTKFLARNLAADPAIELTSLVLVREGRLMRRTDPAAMTLGQQPASGGDSEQIPGGSWETLPTGSSDWDSEQKLGNFRVVVLGRNTEVFLDDEAIERLRKWISLDGGALVCSRGAPANEMEQRLRQLLPVRWQSQSEFRTRAQLTSIGQSASLLPQDLGTGGDPISVLPSLALGARPKVAIGLPQVLVQSTTGQDGQAVPIVSHQPYGSGQAVVVEGAGMWRWAFLPPEKASAQRVYASLWQGLMQWLISQQDLLPGQEIAIRSDRLAYVTGDSVTVSVLVRESFTDKLGDCIVEGGSLELPRRATPVPVSDQAGIYRANFGALPPGHYKASLVGGDAGPRDAGPRDADAGPRDAGQPGVVTEFDVRDPWFERLEVDSRPGLLRQIAKRSGGRLVDSSDADLIGKDYREHLNISRPEKSRRIPLWDRRWVLLTVLAAWIACWITRRSSGLV